MKKKLTTAKLKAKLQPIFNKFIRLRDSEDGWFTCISCGITKKDHEMNAGHFYPVKGYDSIRFDEINVNGECISCNGFNEMHLLGYEKNLINKVGIERYIELQERAKDYKMNGNKWGRIELEEKLEYYKNEVKKLEL